jgi:hypothetical protein
MNNSKNIIFHRKDAKFIFDKTRVFPCVFAVNNDG